MKLLYTPIIAVFLFSCDKSVKNTDTNTVTDTDTTTTAAAMPEKFDDFAITDREDNEGIIVEAGKIYFTGEQTGTITEKYEVMDASGKLIAYYAKNTLTINGNPALNVPMQPNGDFDLVGAKVSWKEGTLWKDNVASQYKIVPNDSKSYLAGSIVFYLFFNLSSEDNENSE